MSEHKKMLTREQIKQITMMQCISTAMRYMEDYGRMEEGFTYLRRCGLTAYDIRQMLSATSTFTDKMARKGNREIDVKQVDEQQFDLATLFGNFSELQIVLNDRGLWKPFSEELQALADKYLSLANYKP